MLLLIHNIWETIITHVELTYNLHIMLHIQYSGIQIDKELHLLYFTDIKFYLTFQLFEST